MQDMLHKLFRGSGAPRTVANSASGEHLTRRSTGLQELTRALQREEHVRVLDLGPTSPRNISHFTGLGHRTYSEDVLLASRDASLLIQGENGAAIDLPRFLEGNLQLDHETFDGVLCWDMFDYLHADLVKPVVGRIHDAMKPGGLLLALFHTRDAGPDAPYDRYHIASSDTLDLQRITVPRDHVEGAGRNPWFRLQRVFNNRHIENLFKDFASIKFFLGRDNLREVLVVR
jgi:SAM-dependent methyltransferase